MFTSAEERGGSEEQRQALESVKRELGRASQQQTRLTRAGSGARNKARITQTEGIVILQAFYSISAYSSFVSPIMCSSSELLGNACVWPD